MTDDELIEWADYELGYNSGAPHEQTDRLIVLARMGAAVKPRPIEEAPKDGSEQFLIRMVDGEVCFQGTGSWGVARPQHDGYRANDGIPAWLQYDKKYLFPEPTHFIPLSAFPVPVEGE
jgi:hypothetical protein